MKKLLSLLGVISLVTTASATVVACGDTTRPVVTNYDKVLNEFKAEINQIVNEHLQEVSKNFYIKEGKSNESFRFIKKSEIEKFMDGSQSKVGDYSIMEDFSKDFNSLLQEDILKYKINSLAKKENYSIILNGVDNVYQGVNLPVASQINLLNINKEVDGTLTWFSTIEFNYSIIVNYKNQEKNSEEYKITNLNSVISLTDNEKIADKVQKFYAQIEKKFILNEVSSISGEKLDINKNYLENNDKEILDYLNGKDYSDSFRTFVNENFQLELKEFEYGQFEKLTRDISYRSEAKKISDSSTITKYQDILFKNEGDFSEIFNATKNDADDLIIKQLESSLDKIEKNLHLTEETKDIRKNSIRMYGSNVTKLSYKVDNNTFISMPDVHLNLSYVKNNGISREEIQEDIAQNIEVAMNAFYEIYGIDLNPEEQQHLARPNWFYFKNNDSKVKKEWNKVWPYPDLNKSSDSNEISSILSLTANSTLNDYRYELLKNSKQSNFNFAVDWSDPANMDNRWYQIRTDSYRERAVYITRNTVNDEILFNTTFEFDYLKLNFSNHMDLTKVSPTLFYLGDTNLIRK
ncbi:lipoprotein [Spiroplasma endosymbiont of Cantharis nigra]|uniref:lipoprotein n=1 Tax=Spiroplasma endosymbiont of Cantharis nigra TaxID=3066278 RepID=UPI0030CD628B